MTAPTPPTDPLAIEITSLAVMIGDGSPSPRQGVVFLRTASEHHIGAETLAERLADPHTHFLPIESEGELELVNLDQLDWIGCAGGDLLELSLLAEVGANRQPVRCELGSGETLVGELVYQAPESASRISDVVNDTQRRFLLVTTGDTARYVNRARIRTVRFGVDLCL